MATKRKKIEKVITATVETTTATTSKYTINDIVKAINDINDILITAKRIGPKTRFLK